MVRRVSAAFGRSNLLRVIAGGATAVVVVAVVGSLLQPGVGAVVPEGGMEFEKDTFTSSEPAVFFIRNAVLQTTPRCLASWIELAAAAGEATVWNLISGEPEPAVHEVSGDPAVLDSACGYDPDDPSNTPLTGLDMQPSVEVYVPLLDNYLPYLSDAYDPVAGTFSLANNVSADSTVEAVFHHHVVDAYAVADQRARVFSSSDPDGEWVGLDEIEAEEDQSPSSGSGLFRGIVSLSDESTYAGSGDHKVFVQPPETLTVEFYSAEAVLIDSARAVVRLGEGEVCDCPIR